MPLRIEVTWKHLRAKRPNRVVVSPGRWVQSQDTLRPMMLAGVVLISIGVTLTQTFKSRSMIRS